MLVVQLRRERPGAVPVNRVAYGHRAIAVNAPCKLVYFFDRECLRSGKCFDALDAAAEIPDFVESVPSGHLQLQLAMHIRNRHRDVKKVLRRFVQRNLICNRGSARQNDKQCEKSLEK